MCGNMSHGQTITDVKRGGSQSPSNRREIRVSRRKNRKRIRVKKKINLGFAPLAPRASHSYLKNSRLMKFI